MKKYLALVALAAVALAASPAGAAVKKAPPPKYPVFKTTITYTATPAPISISVRQLDKTHTALNLRTPYQAGSKTIYLLEHTVCKSKASWQPGVQATATCVPMTATNFAQFQYTPASGLNAVFSYGGIHYVCIGKATGSIKAKSIACLAADASLPRASAGAGQIVLNAQGLQPHDYLPPVGVTIAGAFDTRFGLRGADPDLTITPFYVSIDNASGFDVAVNDLTASSFESTDEVGCPTSDLSIGAWDSSATPVTGSPVAVDKTIADSGSLELGTMMLAWPTTDDAACRAATITVHLATD